MSNVTKWSVFQNPVTNVKLIIDYEDCSCYSYSRVSAYLYRLGHTKLNV